VVIKLKNTPSNLKMLQDQREYYKCGTIVSNKNFVVWAINDKKQVRQFLNLLIDNPLLDYKCSAKTKILKILYGIENNLSYKEYSHLEEDISV